MTSDTELAIKGTLIDGRYEIRARLGQGGMGTVYRALDTKLGTEIALKMLLNRGGSERSKEEARRRFMREIYAINEVQHRNVVHIREFGFYKDTPYMVMELLKGRDLNRILRDSKDLLPIDYSVDLILIVCAAIQACHESGVIHRDLKPGNVMVVDSEFGAGWDVKIVDFGISKVGTDLTRDGQILGTPNYLAPEQLSGKVAPTSDQYAIGLLLYVCLTKQHPFEGLDDLPLVRMIEKGDFKPPRAFRPEIPEELENIILTAMHLDPDKRYATVHELGQKLWPFGSALGQGGWRKYYFETPGIGRARNAVRTTSNGVPLVQRLVEGKVPLTDATAIAHYQSTTAVPPLPTMQDPDAPASGAGSGAGETMVDRDARPAASNSDLAIDWGSRPSSPLGASGLPAASKATPRAGRRAFGPIAAGIFGLAFVIFGVVWAVTKPSTVSSGMTVVHEIAPAPPAANGPVVSPTLPPSPAAAIGATSKPAPAAPGAAGANGEPPSERKPRVHRKPKKTEEWGTDPAGNPIPPL